MSPRKNDRWSLTNKENKVCGHGAAGLQNHDVFHKRVRFAPQPMGKYVSLLEKPTLGFRTLHRGLGTGDVTNSQFFYYHDQTPFQRALCQARLDHCL